MKTRISFHSVILAEALEQFLEISSLARRTHESYAEDLTPIFAEVDQQPITALTADVAQRFLTRIEDSTRG